MEEFLFSLVRFIAPFLAWTIAFSFIAGTLWLIPSVRRSAGFLGTVLRKVPSSILLPSVALLSVLVFLPAIIERAKLINWIP